QGGPGGHAYSRAIWWGGKAAVQPPPDALPSFGRGRTRLVTAEDGVLPGTMAYYRLTPVDIQVANLAKNPEGMLVTADGVPAQRDENIKVSGGFLEGSNVSAGSGKRSSNPLKPRFEAHTKRMKTPQEISAQGPP
ncbi:hypothetical protein KCA24_33495, partial [Escherichia coli]|nr:hypothetical protein [Escherichia coli]